MNIYSDKDYLDSKFAELKEGQTELRDLLIGRRGLVPRVGKIEGTLKAVAAGVTIVLTALGFVVSK